MDWLNQEPSTPRMRLRAMMESGLLVDEEADVIQTQVIAHKARVSIRNRNPVPLYRQTAEGRSPTWAENLLVETGLERPPGQDSRYVLEDSQNLWKGLKNGAVEIDADSKIKSYGIQIVVNVAAVVIFAGCAWLASLNVTEDTVQTPVPTAVAEASIEDKGDHVVDTQIDEEDAAAQDVFGHGLVDGIPASEPPGPQAEEPNDE